MRWISSVAFKLRVASILTETASEIRERVKIASSEEGDTRREAFLERGDLPLFPLVVLENDLTNEMFLPFLFGKRHQHSVLSRL